MTLKTFENKLQELGYKKGCVKGLELINKGNEKKVLGVLEYDTATVYFTYRNNVFIATIDTVDNEKDISVVSAREYFNEYGGLEDAFDSGDITESQYKKLGGIL
mgnify:CR=1 FL=1